MSVPNSNTPPSPRQGPAYPQRFVIGAANLSLLESCPAATSLIAFVPDRKKWLLFSVTCRRWSCPWCARQKIRQLAGRTATATPNRFLTLTVAPTLYYHPDRTPPATIEEALWLADKRRTCSERTQTAHYLTPRDAFESTAPQVPELIRHLRLRFGNIEYLRVTEVTKAGWPHYHLLLRSKYLPHPIVQLLWWQLTQNLVVDVRQVKQSFSAYWYLVKYLSKLHHKAWTERHVSYSRCFFLDQKVKAADHAPLASKQQDCRHPAVYLSDCYAGYECSCVGPGIYELPDTPPREHRTTDPAILALAGDRETARLPQRQQDFPPLPDYAGLPPKKQKQLANVEPPLASWQK